ncbi:MAG: nickel pincer cofactor biosynthesis protein LarC [Clostridiales bacterium]|nr:nickel pincer cofactor biosynthesis protein LarC [Clostridiales bacterium]
MSKILYLECYSGISGDMTVGALLDLGADQKVLESTLESLNLEGYHLHFGRTKKCGIDAYDFDVYLEEDHSHEHKDHEHFGHEQHHHHDHEHHQHEHGHHHQHGHENHHQHEHRNISDIYTIIDTMKASEKVKALSRKIFDIVAEAEVKAHGISKEEVHFHEVGAIDSIVDILSVAICMENLGIDQVILSPLYEGHGFVSCQHGSIPVPVPATANIAAQYALKLKITHNEGEMVTPTGAAIAAALNSGGKLPENYIIKKIGIGAGKKEFRNANILRAMILEEVFENERNMVSTEKTDTLWKLETNLDDCSGEAMGLALECLYQAGAADVWYTPIYMKKNRPAYMLQVLCRSEQIHSMQKIIFQQTTTLGIRRTLIERTILNREIKKIDTPYGSMDVKVCDDGGQVYFYPEYEDIRRVCLEKQRSYKEVYQEVIELCKKYNTL